MRIGRYELIAELARGGMGVVHRAHDPVDGREVAIKLIVAARAADDRARKRFAREVAALSRLSHRNVLSLLDAGEHEGAPYLVLPLVEGARTLQGRLDVEGALPPEEACALAAKVARALAHAHGAGVLHRDVKPDNVLLDGAGEPLLADFGLTRDVVPRSVESSLSARGQVMGTPDFWPPEMAAGALEEVGPAADVYSLGATLFAMLTGRPPFVSTSFLEALTAARNEVPPAPSSLVPDVSPELDAVCLRCLEKRPADRYPDAAALAAALEGLLLARRARRRALGRRAVVAVVAGAAAVGLGVVALAWPRPPAPPPAPPRPVALPDAHPGVAGGLRRDLLDGRRTAQEVVDALAQAAPPGTDPAADALARVAGALALALRPGDRSSEDVLRALDDALETARTERALQAALHLAAAEHLRRRGRHAEALARVEQAEALPAGRRVRLEAHLVRALVLLQDGRLGEWKLALRALERADPDGPFGLLARTANAPPAQRAEAIEPLQLQRRDGRLPAQATLHLAVILSELGQPDETAATLQRYLRQAPDDALAHAWLGIAERERERTVAALDALGRAVALSEPRPLPLALHVRADVRHLRDELADALADLDRAVALQPTAESLLLRGWIHARAGRMPEAEADWLRADALAPWAVDDFLRRQPPAARLAVRRALGLEIDLRPLALDEVSPVVAARVEARVAAAPEAARAPLREALLLAARGRRLSEVLAALREAVSAAPGDATVALEMARVSVAREAVTASRALASARAAGVDAREVDRLEADLARRNGRLSEAARRFEALAGDGDADGVVARAEAALLRGRLDEARAAIDAALRLDPDHPAALALQGELALAGERPALAAAFAAAGRAFALEGGADVRPWLVRLRCIGAVTARELREADDPAATASARASAGLRELTALLEVTPGGSGRVTAAELLLDLQPGAPPIAARLLRECHTLDPERPDLLLALGRLALRATPPQATEVLEAWRRARRVEPLLRLPRGHVEDFERFLGPRPELAELVGEPR